MSSALSLVTLACVITASYFSVVENTVAQSIPLTEGMDYIVGFIHPERAPGEPRSKDSYRLIISSTTGAKISIGQLRSETIAAGDIQEFIIDSCDVIRVTSDRPISVSSRILMSGNGEQTIHVPTYAWGMKYRPFSWWTDRYGLTSITYASAKQLVIARDSNTVVGHSRNGNFFKTTLHAGEYLYISSAIDTNSYRTSASDPTGDLIEASGPIMVISGHPKTAILEHPDGLPATGPYARALNRSRGTLMEAMLPTSYAGTTFVTAPFQYTPTRKRGLDQSDVGVADDRGDVVRIIGLENGTIITRQGADGSITVDTLDEDQVFTARRVEHPYVWVASKPALCAQYGKSYAHVTSQATLPEDDPSTDAGLPMMMNIVCDDRWVDRSYLNAPAGLINYITIVTRSEYIDVLTLDGKKVKLLAKIENLPDGYASMQLMINPGAHLIASSNAEARFIAYTYGTNDGLQLCQAYASTAGVDLRTSCSDSIDIQTTYNSDTAHCFVKVQSPDSCYASGIAMQYVDTTHNCSWTQHDGEFIFIRTSASDSAYANVVVKTRSGLQRIEHVVFEKATHVEDIGRLAQIDVWPQVATDQISIRFPSEVTVPSVVVLHSMIGEVAHEFKPQSNVIDLDVRSFSPGYYVLTVDEFRIPIVIVR